MPFATKELSKFFLYYFDNNFINKENLLGKGGVLILCYINLLLNYYNTTNKYISQKNLKIFLGLCSNRFEVNKQEDSHEFITYLLDALDEDLNKVKYNLSFLHISIH